MRILKIDVGKPTYNFPLLKRSGAEGAEGAEKD